MKEELETIVDLLAEWARDNGKDYVTVDFIDGNGMANIRITDPDHDKLSIFKNYKGENK